MNEDRLAVRVGAATLVALALAVALVLALEGRHLRRGIRLAVEMERAGALQVGAKVRTAGLVLGNVDDIRLIGAPSRALIDVWIDARHAWLVRETTDFFISQEGLLGETYLAIAPRPGEPGPPLRDGQRVRGVDPPRIDRLLATSYANLEAATSIMREGIPEGRALRAALDALSRTMDSLEPVAPTWAAGARLFAEGRALAAGVSGADLARVAAGARALRPPRDLAARLGTVTAAAARVAAASGDPRAVRLAAALSEAGPLIARAEQALATVDALRAQLLSGRGTLGAFLKDVEIFDEIKETTKLMKRQPWLTVGHP